LPREQVKDSEYNKNVSTPDLEGCHVINEEIKKHFVRTISILKVFGGIFAFTDSCI
jgi:hypothetical protein